jgi:hypothetical protein
VGADGEFELLEDDGSGSSADQVNWARTPIKYSQVNGTVSIGPSTGATLKDDGRGWTIRFLALSEPKEMSVSIGTDKRVIKPEKVRNCLVVQVGKVPPNTKATISFGLEPRLSHNDVETFIRPILEDAQIQYSLKEDIWQIVAAKVSSTLKISRLLALEIDESLRDAVLEYLLAE